MANKCLLDELRKLKESSHEAVENAFKFNEFKEYIHIKRPVEDDLYKTICEANESGNSQLILVCGGAGDGKSHILAYLLHKYPWIKQNFKVYNDATESFFPDKTCIYTIDNVLADFSDVNLQKGTPTKKVILASNLGTLSNFIESAYGESYGLLRDYIKSSKLLEVDRVAVSVISNFFRCINFSDYNLFSIEEGSVSSDYIMGILNKITNNNSSNIFYQAYKACCCNACLNSSRCPVKINYEFLFEEKIKAGIINLLVECIIKHKLILTSRAVLNLIYDIISGGLDDSIYEESINKWLSSLKASEFSKYILPNFIFEHPERSNTLYELSRLDPLELRTEFFDDLEIELNISRNRAEVFKCHVNCSTFDSFILELDEEKEFLTLQKLLYRLFFFYGDTNYFNSMFSAYVKYLYYYNKCHKPKLMSLYKLVKDAVYKFSGSSEGGKINVFLNDNQIKYCVSQSIDIKAQLDDLSPIEDDNKFATVMKLSFTVSNSSHLKTIYMDYSLFVLLDMVSNGYKLNKNDRDNFINFVSFVKNISESGCSSEAIFIKLNDDSSQSVFKFSSDELGIFEFGRR